MARRADPRTLAEASVIADDMPSHIRSVLTSTQVSIPVRGGSMGLGTWQAIYVFEHRAEEQTRHILLHLIGE